MPTNNNRSHDEIIKDYIASEKYPGENVFSSKNYHIKCPIKREIADINYKKMMDRALNGSFNNSFNSKYEQRLLELPYLLNKKEKVKLEQDQLDKIKKELKEDNMSKHPITIYKSINIGSVSGDISAPIITGDSNKVNEPSIFKRIWKFISKC